MDKKVLKSKIELCAIIRDKVEEKNLKHREICEKTGKVQSWISKVLCGKVENVSYDAIFEFAKKLDLNIEIKVEDINYKNKYKDVKI